MANQRIVDLATGAALVGTEPFETVQGGISVQIPGSAIAALSVQVTVSTSTRSLLATDAGCILLFTNAGGCALTIPAGLSATFTCVIVQMAAGQVTIAAGGGVTLN